MLLLFFSCRGMLHNSPVVQILLHYAGVLLRFFSGRTTGFYSKANLSLEEKLSSRWSNQAAKIIFTAGQFAQCPALNETPALCDWVFILEGLLELNHFVDMRITCRFRDDYSWWYFNPSLTSSVPPQFYSLLLTSGTVHLRNDSAARAWAKAWEAGVQAIMRYA